MREGVRFPVLKPLLPDAAALRPYLERIDEARWYSNLGPLVRAFEARLAEHFAVPADRVTTSANGTLAMVQALWALGARAGGLCVMPSWTFVATPAAAHAAGLKPFFADVDPATWALDPDAVQALVDQGLDVAAVIPVVPFGAPLDLAAWEAFQARNRIPVLIDAAAGFDTLAGRPTRLPFMVSLHATKLFGVGEGAVLVSPDAELAQTVRRAGNFGFQGTREALTPGFNAKLSEYAGAMGLAAFDQWPATRARWRALTDAFAVRLAALPRLRAAPGFGADWVSSYGLIELPAGLEAGAVAQALAARGVETMAWWGAGCHAHAAYKPCPRTDLPTTERLALRVLGLPFWLGLGDEDLDAVFGALAAVLDGA